MQANGGVAKPLGTIWSTEGAAFQGSCRALLSLYVPRLPFASINRPGGDHRVPQSFHAGSVGCFNEKRCLVCVEDFAIVPWWSASSCC